MWLPSVAPKTELWLPSVAWRTKLWLPSVAKKTLGPYLVIFGPFGLIFDPLWGFSVEIAF